MRLSLRGLFPVLIFLVLAGCGGSSASQPTASRPATSDATSTILPTVTATPPLPTPTVGPHNCATSITFTRSGIEHLGDLLVTPPDLSNLAYPGIKLPDNLPLHSLKLADPGGSNLARDPPTNPDLEQAGYDIAICNASTTGRTHVVTSLSVRIDNLIPY